MTTGVFALVGVVIGALVSGIVQAYFELRRERSDVRQAQRLVAGELAQNYLRMAFMLERDSVPTGGVETMFLSDSAWREYGPTLARHVKEEARFVALQAFMETVMTARDIVAGMEPGQSLPAGLREALETGREQCSASYALLTGKDIEELVDS